MDILEASGAFDPGSNPGRGVLTVDEGLTHFLKYPPGKNNGNKGLPLAKVTTNRLKHMAKPASIPGPLAGFGRGAFLPYFGKQGDI